jgi:hypothetical protein
MNLKFQFTFVVLFFTIVFAQAQGIRGRITNTQGEAIPFVTIYIPELTTGTTSNIDGKYELKLSQGRHIVLFQCLGYQTQKFELLVEKEILEKNVQLLVQDYQIPEIKILASGEDPANYIMRRAIAMAPYFKKQVSKYSCKVYLKGSGVVEKIPGLFKKQMKEAGIELNKPFVMETVSMIDFELPDRLKQRVLAMRSSGKDNNTSPMWMVTSNFMYDAEKNGLISPVGANALNNYIFKLEGVFTDQGRTINKIRIIPKTNGKDVFSGYIYIADLYWNIHSADLYFHPQMADVHVHLLNAEVNKNTFMPVSLDFDIDFAGLGVKMKYNYVASVNEYTTTLNPALDHSFLDRIKDQQLKEQQTVQEFLANEKKGQTKAQKSKTQARIDFLMQKTQLSNRETKKLSRLIDEEAKRNSPPEPLEIKTNLIVSPKQVKNDSAYWNSLRPIPLTDSEKNSFASKDSFLLKASDPAYKDSVFWSKRKFKMKHLIMGKTYNYSVDSMRQYEHFTIPGLINPGTLSFNSVDGLRTDLPFSYSKTDSMGHSLNFTSQLGYAFAREKLDASLQFARCWDGLTNSRFSVGLGTTTSDFNRTTGMTAIDNDFYTLWFEKNYKRFYRRDFLQFDASRDLANGLNLKVTLGYSDNSPLKNHSSYSIIDYKDKEIKANIPENSQLNSWQLKSHQTLDAQAVLEYTPHHRYLIRNNTKIYADSKFPTCSVTYQTALSNVFGSDARYDLVKLGIRQTVDFGIDDHFSYSVTAGKFLNAGKVYFDGFQHFNTQPTNFIFSSYESSFRLLPFYQYSTSNQFLEGHANWQSRRLIVKHLPLIRNTSVSEKLFVNYLSTPELNNYVETGYGISNIFLLLNVEAVAGFEDGKFRSAGIKVSLTLK